jgi:hypothetical protein
MLEFAGDLQFAAIADPEKRLSDGLIAALEIAPELIATAFGKPR